MPAKTTIFNFRGVPQHNFALAPRNTILFSPHGRFVLVAGFGNLAGQMDIYDLEKNYHKVTTVEASNASVCAWSPDGQFILTATTSPRLRVDNGIRIWHVSGALMYNEDMHELYDVFWRPQSTTQHPLTDPFNPLPTPHPSAVAYLSTRKAPVKPAGAYRPPGARGQLTPLAFKREDQGGAAYVRDGITGLNGFGRSRQRAVPGAEPAEEYLPPGAAPGGGVALPPGADQPEKLSKSAARNKKKREAKKQRDAEDGDASQSQSPERRNDKGGHERSKSKANGAPAKPAAAPAPAPAPAPVEDSGAPTAQDKKIRGLLKKIRAIDELKMRLAGGEKLEDTQMKKIQTEEAVRKELEGLGYNG
jgi:translation initiation factor 2A